MPWYESVVLVSREGNQGSGVFVGPGTILTAGHVVQPPGYAPPEADDLAVQLPWGKTRNARVRDVRVHRLWSSQQNLAADMAVLDVAPMTGVGLEAWPDFGAEGDSHKVGLYGYPGGSVPGEYQTSYVHQSDDPANPGFRIFESAGFDIQAGMSGGPFVFELPTGNVYVVGIATYDSVDPKADVFNGLPLLDKTFGELLTP